MSLEEEGEEDGRIPEQLQQQRQDAPVKRKRGRKPKSETGGSSGSSQKEKNKRRKEGTTNKANKQANKVYKTKGLRPGEEVSIVVRHCDGLEINSFSPLVNYFRSQCTNFQQYFEDWDLDSIVRDSLKWKSRVNWLQVYVIVNDCENFDTHTHIGSVNWAVIRLLQHNNLIYGGPQDTKRAAEHWTLAFYMEIAPFRNYAIEDLVYECNQKRGLASRCEYMFEVARELGARYRIAEALIDKNSQFYRPTIVDLVNTRIPREELNQVLFDGSLDEKMSSLYLFFATVKG